MIKLTNLTRQFGSRKVVNDLNLEVNSGEIFGFLGPNGAGKTTTIKMMVGLLKPTTGTVTICDYDIQKEERQAKGCIGFVADEPFLYEKLDGIEFLELVASLYYVPRKEITRRLEELLRLLDLRSATYQLIETYSKGMRRKIALAGALIHNPQVLILDEPTEGLDPPSAKLIKDLLRELTKRGVTVFLTTHILEIAERFCDRVGIINSGSLVVLGTVKELLVVRREKNLEDFFLKLVGGNKYQDLITYLDREWQ